MAIYRGPGGSGDATQDAASEVLLAVQAKEAALAAQAAAEAAQTAAEAAQAAAETAETNAETAETNAETAETNAETAETNAETAATNAASSASAASTSASNASTSATNASNSASAASTSASNAASSSSAASTSASNASTSATNAANSATAAASSATTASNAATAAQTAQTAAELAETNAETAETNAETAETNAAASASAASTSASNAASSASAASTSASNAASSASAASTSASNAATSATNASNSASAASTSATNASNSASAAATSATNAANSATSAATSATNAANSATAAAASAASINPASIVITGGSINGTTIGATTPSTGKFTTLEATGVTTVQAGTVSAPAITTSGDTNTGIFFPAADTIAFTEGGAEAMRIDSSGRVGIGATSPTYTLEVATGTSGQQSLANFRTADSTAANNAGLQIYATPSATAASRSVTAIWDADGADASGGDYFYIQKLGNSGNVEIAQYSNAAMIFSTNVGAERMRITAAGDVGIGTTTPGAPLQARGVNVLSASTRYLKGWIGGAGSWGASSYEELGIGYSGIRSLYTSGDNWDLTFATGTSTQFSAGTQAERMRIHSNGYITMGTTNTNIDAGPGFKFIATTNAYIGMVVESSINSQTNYHLYSTGAGTYRFYVGAGGTIYATATTIVAISDVRLKENIQDIDVGLDAIMALKPRKFDWKEGKGKDKKGDRGWIAQEFEQVFPDMIENWKDPAPEGEEPYKAVSADLIPVLVKAIQEQQAQIEELKQEIAALKAK